MTTQGQKNYIANKSLAPLPQPHLTGLKLQEDISLNGFVFNKIDAYGVLWVITDIKGWWNPPTPDILDIKRGWNDGSYDVKGRYQSRELTLEGSILCTVPTLAPAARSRLVAAINLVRQGAWLKTEEDPTKASYVRLSGEPNIETVSARGRIDFSIGLRAADPIKYSWNNDDVTYGYDTVSINALSASPSHTGISTITNDGDVDVSVYLTITGPIVGPANIINTTNSETITITGTLRGAVTKTVNNKAISNSVVTLTTSTAHGLVVGDVVTVSSVGAVYNGDQVVSSIPTTTTFTYLLTGYTGANVSSTAGSGTVAYGPDLLEIDTYNREVTLNGEFTGARLKLEVYNEWITLSPGANVISFYDNGAANSTANLTVDYRSGWLA